jgi:hypothetical protein
MNSLVFHHCICFFFERANEILFIKQQVQEVLRPSPTVAEKNKNTAPKHNSTHTPTAKQKRQHTTITKTPETEQGTCTVKSSKTRPQPKHPRANGSINYIKL